MHHTPATRSNSSCVHCATLTNWRFPSWPKNMAGHRPRRTVARGHHRRPPPQGQRLVRPGADLRATAKARTRHRRGPDGTGAGRTAGHAGRRLRALGRTHVLRALWLSGPCGLNCRACRPVISWHWPSTGQCPKASRSTAMPSTPPPECQRRRRRGVLDGLFGFNTGRGHCRARILSTGPSAKRWGRCWRHSLVSMIHHTARCKARPVMG